MKTSKRDTTVTIRLPQDLKKDIQKLADSKNATLSSTFRDLLDYALHYLKKGEK